MEVFSMPRFPRSYIKTEYFHIITQGINKSYIFDVDEDIKYYIKNMYKYAEKSDVKVIAYCIMDNHAHILINVSEIHKMSEYMHNINTEYGKYYNRKYKRVGYVFRDRYKSEGIYSEKHLYNCIKYIYNNPVKAGICLKPNEYKYSNYKRIEETVDTNYSFIDIDKDSDEEIVNDYLENRGIKIEELLKNDYELKQAITILKRDNGISLRSLSRILKINREVLRKKYKK